MDILYANLKKMNKKNYVNINAGNLSSNTCMKSEKCGAARGKAKRQDNVMVNGGMFIFLIRHFMEVSQYTCCKYVHAMDCFIHI